MDFLDFLPGGMAKAALASIHYEQYETSNKLSDLDEAISAINAAINETSPRSTDNRRARYLMQHGMFIYAKYERTGNNSYYTEAMSRLKETLRETERVADALDIRESTLQVIVAMLKGRWNKSKMIPTLVELSEAELEVMRLLWRRGKKKSSGRMLQEASNSCLVAWNITKDPKHIERAVQGFRSMLDVLASPGSGRTVGRNMSDDDDDSDGEPAPTPSPEVLYCGILDLLQMKREATKATSDILAFNKVVEEYIRQCKPPRLRQLHVLADLKDMWKKAYHANKTDEILDGLIDAMKKIAVKTERSDGYPQIDTFNDLSGYLAERHRRSKRINDLKESIEYAIKTYKAASADKNGKVFENMIMKGGARGGFLWNIAEKYFQLFQSTKGNDDLEKAIGYLEDSVKYTKPDEELVLSQRYHALGSWYKALYSIAKNRKTLEKSVKAFEEAVVAIPGKQRAFVGDFDDLVDEIVKGYTLLHEVTGDAEFLSKANQAKGKREASKKIDSEVKTRRVEMEKSVFGALSAFQVSMKEEDLDKAISEVRKQFEREENPGGMMDALKTRLVNLLMERYQGLGGVEDLREVIKLVSYPIGNINWTVGVENKDDVSLNLSIRSLAHGYLFEREFEEKDWDNAVRFGKAAVSLSESEEVHPRNVIYAHMGVIHMSKFKQDREIAWLDEATTWFRKAVDANEGSETGKADTYDLCRDMANLASSGYMKFEMTGKLGDLQTAIGWAEEAMEVDDSGRPWKATLASNLGSMLHSRFTRLRDDSDLEEAIRLHREATKTSKGALGDFSKMNNLASALFTRFQISGSEEDLDDAIQLLQDANEKVPIDHPNAHPLLQNLRKMEAARQAAKSKVPPMFRMMVEALTGMPFDESSVPPYVQALLDQGKRNGEFGPDGLGFNPFAGLLGAPGMGGLALPDLEDLDLPDLGRLRMEAPRPDEFGTAERTSGRGPPRGLPGFEQARLSAPKQETRAESSTNRLGRGFPDFDRVSNRVRPNIIRQGSEGQSIEVNRYPARGLPIIAESSSNAPRYEKRREHLMKQSPVDEIRSESSQGKRRSVRDFFSLGSKRKSQVKGEDGKS